MGTTDYSVGGYGATYIPPPSDWFDKLTFFQMFSLLFGVVLALAWLCFWLWVWWMLFKLLRWKYLEKRGQQYERELSVMAEQFEELQP
jgi:hypothetical protein